MKHFIITVDTGYAGKLGNCLQNYYFIKSDSNANARTLFVNHMKTRFDEDTLKELLPYCYCYDLDVVLSSLGNNKIWSYVPLDERQLSYGQRVKQPYNKGYAENVKRVEPIAYKETTQTKNLFETSSQEVEKPKISLAKNDTPEVETVIPEVSITDEPIMTTEVVKEELPNKAQSFQIPENVSPDVQAMFMMFMKQNEEQNKKMDQLAQKLGEKTEADGKKKTSIADLEQTYATKTTSIATQIAASDYTVGDKLRVDDVKIVRDGDIPGFRKPTARDLIEIKRKTFKNMSKGGTWQSNFDVEGFDQERDYHKILKNERI